MIVKYEVQGCSAVRALSVNIDDADLVGLDESHREEYIRDAVQDHFDGCVFPMVVGDPWYKG